MPSILGCQVIFWQHAPEETPDLFEGVSSSDLWPPVFAEVSAIVNGCSLEWRGL
jgi:hypothetical protein